SPPAHTVPPLDAAYRCVPVPSTNGASTPAGARGYRDRDRLAPLESYRVSRPSLRVSLRGDLIDRSPPAVRHPRRSSRNPRRADTPSHAPSGDGRWVRDPVRALLDCARPSSRRAFLRRLSHRLPHLRLPSLRHPSHEATSGSGAIPTAPAHGPPFRN